MSSRGLKLLLLPASAFVVALATFWYAKRFSSSSKKEKAVEKDDDNDNDTVFVEEEAIKRDSTDSRGGILFEKDDQEEEEMAEQDLKDRSSGSGEEINETKEKQPEREEEQPQQQEPSKSAVVVVTEDETDTSELTSNLSQIRLSPESRPETADSGKGHSTTGASDGGLGSSLCDGNIEEGSSSSGGGSSANSVVCSDSGRGSEAADDLMILAYHFHIPSILCGRFIGSGGVHVNRLRTESKCRIVLRDNRRQKENNKTNNNNKNNRRKNDQNEYEGEFQLCIIEGTRSSIDKCLDMIRDRFPLKDFPDLTLEQVNVPMAVVATPALSLAYGVTIEVVVSAIVSPSHVFVQQPTHPTYPALERLADCINRCYTELVTPELFRPLEFGVVCVAHYSDFWSRVQIVAYNPLSDIADVKFLDYGGYASLPASDLRQIRSDFLSLPFQAIECYLANVVPVNSTITTPAEWSLESAAVMEELVSYKIASARMLSLAEDSVPLIHLYVSDPSYQEGCSLSSDILVNRFLVNRGFAAWIEHIPPPPQQQQQQEVVEEIQQQVFFGPFLQQPEQQQQQQQPPFSPQQQQEEIQQQVFFGPFLQQPEQQQQQQQPPFPQGDVAAA